MSRRHHRRGGMIDTGWKGISAGRGKCALYFHNPHPSDLATVVFYGKNITSEYSQTFEMSTDGNNWITWGTIVNNGSLTYNIPSGNYLYIRNISSTPTSLSALDNGTIRYYNFDASDERGLILGGDVRSLLCRSYDTQSWTGWTMIPYTFYSLFATDTHLNNRITLAQWSNGIFYRNTIRDVRFDLAPYGAQVASYCYSYMFAGIECAIPVESRCKPFGDEIDVHMETGSLLLPKYHAPYCMSHMFNGAILHFGGGATLYSNGDTGYSVKGTDCHRIITMPPGTTTADHSMSYMFSESDCRYSPIDDTIYGFGSGYIDGSSVSGHLSPYCYAYMFANCQYLLQAPVLWHNTPLSNYCYTFMFTGCTALKYPPELGATTLSTGCYASMFKNCTSLEQAPELPAINLVSHCYREMFYNCSILKYVNAKFITTPGSSYTYNWLYGVYNSDLTKSMGGIFVKNPAAIWNTGGTSGVPTGGLMSGYAWKIVNYDGLIFYSTTGSANWYMSFEASNSAVSKTVQYSIDGTTWYDYNTGSPSNIQASQGFVLWRSTQSQPYGDSSGYYNSFRTDHECFCFGKISSMNNGSHIASAYHYRNMFDSAPIHTAPIIDISTVSTGCFMNMFSECGFLEYAPYIWHFNIDGAGADSSFEKMFFKCGALQVYPIIKNAGMDWYSHMADSMFAGCSVLMWASPFMSMNDTQYRFGSINSYSFRQCFSGCTSLAAPPNLNFSGNGIESMAGMFENCTNLEWAPPIVTDDMSPGGTGMMNQMFFSCTGLSRICAYFNTTPGTNWTSRWVYGVLNHPSQFCKSGNWNVVGIDGIPTGWTVFQVYRPNLNHPDW